MKGKSYVRMAAKKNKKDIEKFTLNSSEVSEVSETPAPSDTPEEETFSDNKRNKAWIAFFVTSIVLAIIAGLFIYRMGATKLNVNNQNAPIPLPSLAGEQQVSPIPKPEIISTFKYKIEVLNGSGIKGEAAKVKELLEAEKFSVSSIGNADNSDYQKTIIQAKKTVPREFLDKVKSFLVRSYVLDKVKELDESEKFDAIITVGSKKVEGSD